MAGSPRIDELKKKFDENPGRYFAPLANEYRKAGQIEQAIEICRMYLAQKPGHMSGLIVFGQALYEGKQLEEARSTFEQALALDPENLIALRHLGDIARDIGDPGAARGWYQRVLDADPRNEEIAAALAAVTAEAAAGAPADAAESSSGVSGWGDINPEQAEAAAASTVILEPAKPQIAPSVPPSSVETSSVPPSSAPPVEIPRISLELSSLETPTPAAAPAAPEARTVELEPPKPAERVSLGLSSLRIEQEQEFDSSIASAGSGARTSGIDLERPYEAPPGASEAGSTPGLETTEFQPPVGKIPSGRDSISGFVVEEPPAWETARQDAPSPSPAPGFVTETMAELYLKQGYRTEAISVYRQLVEQNPGDAALRDKLRGLERESDQPTDPIMPAATRPSAPSAPPPIIRRAGGSGRTVRSFFGSLAGRKAPSRPAEAESAPAGPSEAGVTGPSDWIMEPAPPAPPPPATVTPAASPVAGAPEAFGSSPEAWPEPPAARTPTPAESGGWGIAPVTPPATASRTPSPRFGSPVIVPTTAVSTPQPAPAFVEPPKAPEPAAPAASGSLDSLFGGAAVQSEDADAAILLAGAFGPPQTPAASQPQYPGQPTRAASNELSLDNVFRDTPRKSGAVRTTGGFSFDQFFSDTAAGREKDESSERAPGKPPSTREATGEDEAQFSSWLEGLKKK